MSFIRRNFFLFGVAFLLLTACQSLPIQKNSQETKPQTQTNVSPELLQIFVNASLFRMSGRYADAILELEGALQYSDSWDIYYFIADSYFALERYPQAIEYAQQAVKRAPTEVAPRELLAKLFEATGQWEHAQQLYQQLYSETNTLDYGIALARVYERTDQEAAVELYKQLLRREENTQLLYNLTALLIQQKRFEEAWEYCQRLVQNHPASPSLTSFALAVLVELGDFPSALQFLEEQKYFFSSELFRSFLILVAEQLYQHSPDTIAQALPHFSKLAEQYPQDTVLPLLLGYLALKGKDSILASTYFDRYLAIQEDPGMRIYDVALTFLQSGYPAMAARYLEKYPPDSTDPQMLALHFFTLGNISIVRKDYDAARKALLRALWYDSTNPSSWNLLGIAYHNLKQQDSALAAYRKAWMLDSTDPTILNNYAYQLAIMELSLDTALQYAEKAVAHDSTNASYLDTIGWIYFKLGNFAKALYWLEKAVRKEQSAELLEHLGEAYFAVQKYREAMTVWQKALQLDPSKSFLQEKIKKAEEMFKQYAD